MLLSFTLSVFSKNSGLYYIVEGTNFDPMLAYLSFRRLQEVDCERTFWDTEDPFLRYNWNTGEPFGLPDEYVHEQKQNAAGQILYDECRFPPVSVT